MQDWNVIVTIRDEALPRARRRLKSYGPIEVTSYLNVLVMRVEQPETMLEGLKTAIEQDPAILTRDISTVAVGRHCFSFQSPMDFEAGAREAVLALVPALRGSAFHVRIRRRGFKGRLSTRDQERYLGRELLDALAAGGEPGRISFDDPDAIVVIEIVSNRACVSCWTRDELKKYAFLRLD